ncbi:MAG: hypothetical protein WC495_06745 [Patescibacteria group bacterium]|jgi:hypothetical protein
MECIFSEPLNYTGSPPAEGDPFAFSEMICTDDRYEQYTNTGSGATFYMQKSLSYGDVLVLVFLILFFVAGVFKLMWNFNFKDWNAKL